MLFILNGSINSANLIRKLASLIAYAAMRTLADIQKYNFENKISNQIIFRIGARKRNKIEILQ